MATKDKGGDNNKILWVAGTAAVTAFVVWYVNKELRAREDLQKMKMMQELKELKGA